MATERTRIQNTLIALAQAGKFLEVCYDENDLAFDIDPDAAPVVAPDSVKCNELESQFAVDAKYGLGLKLERISWVFDLLLEWDNIEVTLEYFERSLETPPVIAKSGNLRQACLILLNTVVEHPVTKSKSSGTVAKLTFRAQLGRN